MKRFFEHVVISTAFCLSLSNSFAAPQALAKDANSEAPGDSASVKIKKDASLASTNAKAANEKDSKKQTGAMTSEDKKTINAVNQIPGVNVDEKMFEAKEKKSLNPVSWFFSPVTKMQKQVVHLEQQIMRLEGPIAGLQKPM